MTDQDFEDLLGQPPATWAASGWSVERIQRELIARGHEVTVDLLVAVAGVLEGAGLPQVTSQTFTVGQAVTWRWVPRAKYGFAVDVDGIVSKVGAQRVQIEVVTKKTGDRVRRWVDPSSLTPRG